MTELLFAEGAKVLLLDETLKPYARGLVLTFHYMQGLYEVEYHDPRLQRRTVDIIHPSRLAPDDYAPVK